MQVIHIPVECVERDSNHLRQGSTKERVSGLARSMDEVGLLHPILVRRTAAGYRLVAGERRLEAAIRLGYACIPAIVLEVGVSDKQVQLIENLQREDLNPVERAVAVREFMMAEQLTKVAAARRLGVPRTTLTEWLNVLDVPTRYQRAVVDNFNGGDSPLTVSHISEAKGLAVRLRSPGMCTVVLDAVMEYRLSKVETREVCALVRQNTALSIDRAVLIVRRPAEVNRLATETPDARRAVERNLDRWRTNLQRSTDTLTELRRVSPRYLADEERKLLYRALLEMRKALEEAMENMSAVDMELPKGQAS